MLNKSTILLAAIILIGVIIWQTPLLSISNWEVKIDQNRCIDQEIVLKVLNKYSANILTISKEPILKELQKNYPCVKDLDLNYQPLKTIEVTILTRSPHLRVIGYSSKPILDLSSLEATPSSSAAILDWSVPVSSDSSGLVSDETGVIFETSSDQSLPLLFTTQSDLKLSSILDQKLINTISRVLVKLKELNIGFSFLKQENDYLMADTNPKIIFSLSEDILRQEGSLQLILRKSTIENKEVESVDLRFNKPVVVYRDKKK